MQVRAVVPPTLIVTLVGAMAMETTVGPEPVGVKAPIAGGFVTALPLKSVVIPAICVPAAASRLPEVMFPLKVISVPSVLTVTFWKLGFPQT